MMQQSIAAKGDATEDVRIKPGCVPAPFRGNRKSMEHRILKKKLVILKYASQKTPSFLKRQQDFVFFILEFGI